MKILVTAALPYANGPIHLGHILEQIQTDIWVRWQQIQGNECYFVCGDDAHGTAIMLSAKERQISPEQLIAEIKTQHETDLTDFYIGCDSYFTTHSPENRKLALTIYQKLCANNDIETRMVAQSYDPKANMFLPDRFVKGTCPKCGATDQYGDNCEKCGATYNPVDLIDPISKISGVKPIQKSSEHYFFRLEKYTDTLKQWTQNRAHLQPAIAHKLNEWFEAGLMQWDISRDAPYFGFEIPDSDHKYFYVWMDAPIGYMASFKKLCELANLNFDEYWNPDSTTQLYHFVGKDIIYFHALFWPAILKGSGYRMPTAIFTHGFLTINGQKMSKSRGTFITARRYLDNLNPEYLRYYFAAKLNSGIDDIDLSFDDFMQRVNSDLIGKIVNIASRCAKFINNNFANQLSIDLDNPDLYDDFIAAGDEIGKCYQNREYNNAIRKIMELADLANQYIDGKKPWSLAKQNPSDPAVQTICSCGLNLFRVLMIYLKPVLPKMAADVEEFFLIPPLSWNDRIHPLLNQPIALFKPLMQRVDPEKCAALTK